MSTPTTIQPFTQTTTNVITSFTISCRSLNLFNNASFTVDSFDSQNNLVTRQIVDITNQQYLQWNNNDTYIVNLVAQILGYTIVNTSGAQATVENGP